MGRRGGEAGGGGVREGGSRGRREGGRNTQTGCTGAWGVRERALREDGKKNKTESHRKEKQNKTKDGLKITA